MQSAWEAVDRLRFPMRFERKRRIGEASRGWRQRPAPIRIANMSACETNIGGAIAVTI